MLDAALHLGPNFEAKWQYMLTRYGSDDLGLIRQQGWYAQVSYKLAGLNLELPGINNLELVGRYDNLANGYDSGSGIFYGARRYSIGTIYYLTSALLLEGDYEFINSRDASLPSTQLILQISYGF